MTESKKLQTKLAPDGRTLLDCSPFAVASGEANRIAGIATCRHDARIAHEQREVIRKAHELVGFILSAAEDQVSINLELGQTHEERERRKVQLLGFIRGNLDQVIDRAEPFMAAAAPFFED